MHRSSILKSIATKPSESLAWTARKFKFLRELLNGYALVMLHYPELKMSEAAMTRVELVQMFREYKEADDERQAAAAKKKAKL